MNQTYYAMKNRLGGEKNTARDNLCMHWYPCPGFNIHKEVVGERRGEILFKRYSGNYSMRQRKKHLLYWRFHPTEWTEILRRIDSYK